MNIDLLSAVIGGILGLLSGIIILFLQQYLDRKGQLKTYAKIVCEQLHGQFTWGFRAGDSGITLHVPIWLEFQNTTNTTRIMRDVNLLLYKDGNFVSEMVQVNRSGNSSNQFVYGDNGSYSFTVPTKSTKQFTCHFLLKKDAQSVQYFDQIMLRYYDEKDCVHLLRLGDFEGDWTLKQFQRPQNYFLLHEHGAPGVEKKLSMGEEKIAFLELIQEPISRMSTTSAIYKGFAATIVAGISALSYKDLNLWVLGLSFLPVLAFAVLDMYYLKLEKGFRYLYNRVRLDLRNVDFNVIPYADGINKDPVKKKEAKLRIWDLLRSPSIWLFYPTMIAIVIIVFLMKYKGIL